MSQPENREQPAEQQGNPSTVQQGYDPDTDVADAADKWMREMRESRGW
ncbi:hypothetical protein [Shimazuella kribbensis]|nr:hypothetical protein [Shimazuella kribbensis]